MINKLKKILASDSSERKKLVKELQEEVWNYEVNKDNPFNEMLSELAYDLDFYEPDESLRIQDASYYGDEQLEAEILAALKKLEVVERLQL